MSYVEMIEEASSGIQASRDEKTSGIGKNKVISREAPSPKTLNLSGEPSSGGEDRFIGVYTGWIGPGLA